MVADQRRVQKADQRTGALRHPADRMRDALQAASSFDAPVIAFARRFASWWLVGSEGENRSGYRAPHEAIVWWRHFCNSVRTSRAIL